MRQLRSPGRRARATGRANPPPPSAQPCSRPRQSGRGRRLPRRDRILAEHVARTGALEAQAGEHLVALGRPRPPPCGCGGSGRARRHAARRDGAGLARLGGRGFVASHLAGTTRCWLPPESVRTGLSGSETLMPRSPIQQATVGFHSSSRDDRPREDRPCPSPTRPAPDLHGMLRCARYSAACRERPSRLRRLFRASGHAAAARRRARPAPRPGRRRPR